MGIFGGKFLSFLLLGVILTQINLTGPDRAVAAGLAVKASDAQIIMRDRLNLYRAEAGVPPVWLDRTLDISAQNHSNYMIINQTLSHDEDARNKGFTGVRALDRAKYADKEMADSKRCCNEVIALTGSEDSYPAAAWSVDGWLDTLYHRLGVLDPAAIVIGAGVGANDPYYYSTIDLRGAINYPFWKNHQAEQHNSAAQTAILWPPSGATNVFPAWLDTEWPDPLVGKSHIAGTVITAQWPANVVQGEKNILLDYSLTDDKGNTIECYSYSPASDPNIGATTVALIPVKPLAKLTLYKVHLHVKPAANQAVVSEIKAGTSPINLDWSFTTGDVHNGMNISETRDDLLSGGVEVFPTGYSLQGIFQRYWHAHGGLAQFGYPVSTAVAENGYVVQYFERNRLEYHPEFAGTPYAVELGLLGRDVANSRYGSGNPIFQPATSNGQGQFFAATRHNLGGSFLTYWQQHGGLAQFGYPLTEEFQETSREDGRTYTVQYFERNRFEYHPEKAGTPYNVLLGLLGDWKVQQSILATPPGTGGTVTLTFSIYYGSPDHPTLIRQNTQAQKFDVFLNSDTGQTNPLQSVPIEANGKVTVTLPVNHDYMFVIHFADSGWWITFNQITIDEYGVIYLDAYPNLYTDTIGG